MKQWSVIVFLSFILVATACSEGSGGQAATAESLGQGLVQTATAQAAQVVESGDTIATAEAEATVQRQLVEATQVAEATIEALNQAATATAVAPIEAELRSYGIDPSQGRLGKDSQRVQKC